jgi:hypothetical protein
LLCYLSGDSDTATIAQSGLSMASKPDFALMADILFSKTDAPGRLKRYWQFSAASQTHTLKFVLDCLLDDQLYSEDGPAIGLFLNAISTTLAKDRLPVELFDMCSACLLSTLSTSESARSQFVAASSFNHNHVVDLALKSSSSAARRDLAAVYGELLNHDAFWIVPDKDYEWIEVTRVREHVETCLSIIPTVKGTHITESTNLYGAITLASYLVKAVRLRGAAGMAVSTSMWEKTSLLIASIARFLESSNNDTGIKTAAEAVTTCLSYDSVDCPVLDSRLYSCVSTALDSVTAGLKKYGHGDSVSAPLARKHIEAAGMCLAASTTASCESEFSLGSKRIDCVESLIGLLGSPVYRKDEEISIVVGEALSHFADAYSPPDSSWSKAGTWAEEYDASLAHSLPPHEHTLYVLIRKLSTSSSPHTKTSAAPALLAVVARAARSVRF